MRGATIRWRGTGMGATHSLAASPAAGFAAAMMVRLWMRTLQYKVAYYDVTVDPAEGRNPSPSIYVFWHEYLLFPITLRCGYGLRLLVSRHRDAAVLGAAAQYFGFGVILGSTRRGGASASLEIIRGHGDLRLVITPDGPRGPRRQMALGPIYLAAKLGAEIIPLGFGYDRPWRMPSWDRFAIPRPFSRARCVAGPAIRVPPESDRETMEHFREKLEKLLNDLTHLAEDWARHGYRIAGELPVRPMRKITSWTPSGGWNCRGEAEN